MSAPAASATPSTDDELESALKELGDHAEEFARLSPRAKAGLLRSCIPRLVDAAPSWVEAGRNAKGLAAQDAGEEWLAGPMPTIRMARLLAESLEAIAESGKPPLGVKAQSGMGGRLQVDVFPSSAIDRILFQGFHGFVLMQEGIDREKAVAAQAEFYDQKNPEGGISLVLGAGNVSSIPPMDAFTKLFIEGKVVLLKMNPVNEWVGPSLEHALKPLIARGFLRIVYGGGEVGRYLVEHKAIADVHITGSDKTHDLIVWGPAGPERERRMRENDPVLKVPIGSELGNVSPVVVLPFEYKDDELDFQARNVATMVTNNGSFNCNAAKMLVTAKGWSQRDRFMERVRFWLRSAPARLAYYPGAFERYESLVSGRDGVTTIGSAPEGHLPWTLIENVNSESDDMLFTTEPFCAILSETQIGSGDPIAFLNAATGFLNDKLWGTLNACLIVPPELESDPTVLRALEECIVTLRYGTVAINCWPAVCYGSCTLPWGGHASATLDNIQSGLGWVHNTYMLGAIDKSVIRAPIKSKPTPPWFVGHRSLLQMGPRLVQMEADPGWRKVPGIALRALFG